MQGEALRDFQEAWRHANEEALVAEDDVANASSELRRYLAERCAALLARPDFADTLAGMIVPDEALAERVQTALQRLTSMARLA